MIRLKPTRLLALGALVLLVFFYWKPMHTYLRTKHELESNRAQVHALQVQQARLQKQIAALGSNSELVQEARRLGLVKAGEQLFIVKGIPQWRKTH